MSHVYDTLQTPVGEWLVVANDQGVTAIARSKNADDLSDRMAQHGAGLHSPRHPIVQEAKKQLTAYFQGTLQAFSFPVAPAATPFKRKVWEAMATIPYGQTVSYSELATMAGNPAAFRAAASACATNPLAIYHPCHRVLHKGGHMSGYAYGTDIKEWLLTHEAKMSAKRAA